MAKGAQVNRGGSAINGQGSGRSGKSSPPGRLLPRCFFEQSPKTVAPGLLGKLLVRRAKEGVIAGRIVEAEAYLGPHHAPPDPAAHAHRGPTPRNLVLFGPAGHAYVYSIYGMYFCMNISCEIEGQAGCVLLRALEPVMGLDLMAKNRDLDKDAASPRLLTSGPSRLCEALGLTRIAHNGLDVTGAKSELQVRDDGCVHPEALVTARIGIKHAVDWPLRFALPEHACVSGARNLTGSRIRLT